MRGVVARLKTVGSHKYAVGGSAFGTYSPPPCLLVSGFQKASFWNREETWGREGFLLDMKGSRFSARVETCRANCRQTRGSLVSVS